MAKKSATIISIAALLATGGTAAIAGLSEGVWRSRYQEFTSETERVQRALASIYGTGWTHAGLTSEILREVIWMESEATRLRWDAARVKESADNLDREADTLERKARILQIDMESLGRQMQPLIAELTDWNEKLAENSRRAVIHNSRPPSSDDPAAVAAYIAEAEAGNAEAKRFQSEMERVLGLLQPLEEKKQKYMTDAITLATRDRYLERQRQAFVEDAARFTAQCDEALNRTRALAVIAGSKPADLVAGFRRVYEPRPNAVVETLKSFGESAAVQALSKLALPLSGGTAATVGAAISARDFALPHVKSGGEDVHDRLLLVGDYAAALKRLQRQGRLKESDPDYQALKTMLARTGQEMPRNEFEFLKQSTKLTAVLKDGLSTLAKGYVLKKVTGDGGKLAPVLVRKEKESISRQSARLSAVFEASVKTTATEKLGDAAWDGVVERTKRDWDEAQRSVAAKKGAAR